MCLLVNVNISGLRFNKSFKQMYRRYAHTIWNDISKFGHYRFTGVNRCIKETKRQGHAVFGMPFIVIHDHYLKSSGVKSAR